MNTQEPCSQKTHLSTAKLNDIPLAEIASFMDSLANLYSQYQDVASVCHSLAPHFEQDVACKKKTQLLEIIRIEAEAHLDTLKNNMFIEIRAIMRDYLKPEQ